MPPGSMMTPDWPRHPNLGHVVEHRAHRFLHGGNQLVEGFRRLADFVLAIHIHAPGEIAVTLDFGNGGAT